MNRKQLMKISVPSNLPTSEETGHFLVEKQASRKLRAACRLFAWHVTTVRVRGGP